MNNRFSEIFIRRPVATILLTIGVVFAGLLGYSQLPVSPLPQVDFPVISVQANMPGAQPGHNGDLGRGPARAAFGPDRRR